jgi:hypothetical protein
MFKIQMLQQTLKLLKGYRKVVRVGEERRVLSSSEHAQRERLIGDGMEDAATFSRGRDAGNEGQRRTRRRPNVVLSMFTHLSRRLCMPYLEQNDYHIWKVEVD